MGQSCRRVKKISNDTGVRSDLNSIDWLPKAPPSINQAQNEQKVYSSKEEPRTRGNHNENQNTTEIEELGTTITTGYGDKRNKIFSTLQDIYGPELGSKWCLDSNVQNETNQIYSLAEIKQHRKIE
ncbi:uncharacterized protein [Rhodnius prolixus]|uniref:uncharacterized protein n=1 Tax=Rhodnius prolixus TaxID=13249 RepID=UPI003D18F9D7